MTSIGYSVTLNDAEIRAKKAADVVMASMANAVVEAIPSYFEGEAEKRVAGQQLDGLMADTEFRARLESAFIAWLAQTHVILPPAPSE